MRACVEAEEARLEAARGHALLRTQDEIIEQLEARLEAQSELARVQLGLPPKPPLAQPKGKIPRSPTAAARKEQQQMMMTTTTTTESSGGAAAVGSGGGMTNLAAQPRVVRLRLSATSAADADAALESDAAAFLEALSARSRLATPPGVAAPGAGANGQSAGAGGVRANPWWREEAQPPSSAALAAKNASAAAASTAPSKAARLSVAAPDAPLVAAAGATRGPQELLAGADALGGDKWWRATGSWTRSQSSAHACQSGLTFVVMARRAQQTREVRMPARTTSFSVEAEVVLYSLRLSDTLRGTRSAIAMVWRL